jgi:hypothetical protein
VPVWRWMMQHWSWSARAVQLQELLVAAAP